MVAMEEWLEFLLFLVVLGCIIWWIVIGIGIMICRITGKYPKDQVCRDSSCKYKSWCRRYR